MKTCFSTLFYLYTVPLTYTSFKLQSERLSFMLSVHNWRIVKGRRVFILHFFLFFATLMNEVSLHYKLMHVFVCHLLLYNLTV